jgi:hypothetical protein
MCVGGLCGLPVCPVCTGDPGVIISSAGGVMTGTFYILRHKVLNILMVFKSLW